MKNLLTKTLLIGGLAGMTYNLGFSQNKLNQIYSKIKIQNTDSIKLILDDRNKDKIIDEINYIYYFSNGLQYGVYSGDEDHNGLFETTLRISEGDPNMADLKEFKGIPFNEISQSLKNEQQREYKLK